MSYRRNSNGVKASWITLIATSVTWVSDILLDFCEHNLQYLFKWIQNKQKKNIWIFSWSCVWVSDFLSAILATAQGFLMAWLKLLILEELSNYSAIHLLDLVHFVEGRREGWGYKRGGGGLLITGLKRGIWKFLAVIRGSIWPCK